ncbi:MAG TPA: H-NS histone family protein, partial [Xanthomonadaceae bacterium]|nr:H-NS histone family protein [Xanthomonadaceae bacterium]
LNSLINQAKKRKLTLGKRKPALTVRKKVTALARAEGYTLEELFGTGGASTSVATRAPRKTAVKRTRKSSGKVAPKSRNPANSTETWTGRGRQPRWLAAETGKGRKLDEFLIRA